MPNMKKELQIIAANNQSDFSHSPMHGSTTKRLFVFSKNRFVHVKDETDQVNTLKTHTKSSILTARPNYTPSIPISSILKNKTLKIASLKSTHPLKINNDQSKETLGGSTKKKPENLYMKSFHQNNKFFNRNLLKDQCNKLLDSYHCLQYDYPFLCNKLDKQKEGREIFRSEKNKVPWYKKFLAKCQATTATPPKSSPFVQKPNPPVRSTDAVLETMDRHLLDIHSTNQCYFHYSPKTSVFSKWRVINTLGFGTFAKVYKVQHRHSGKLAAGKLLEPQKFDMVTQERISEMFSKEIRYLVKCQCPGVVTVYELVRGFEGWLLVQELVSGGTLWDDSSSQCEMEQFLLFSQLLQTLLTLQERGIVHRDLKPTNILRFKQGGRLCVTDFGWSESVENLNNYNHELPGTIEINPPEVLQHRNDKCQKIDNYALALNMMLLFSHQFICRDEKLSTKDAARQMLKSIALIRNGRPLPGFSQDAWTVFLGLSEFQAKQRFSLLEVVESSWYTRMMCNLIHQKSISNGSHNAIVDCSSFFWHETLRTLARQLHTYIKTAPKLSVSPYNTKNNNGRFGNSKIPFDIYTKNLTSTQGIANDHTRLNPTRNEKIDEDDYGNIYCSDAQSTTNSSKVYDVDSESVARRRQWNRWFNCSSNNTSQNLETSSVSPLAKIGVESVTMDSLVISLKSPYKCKHGHKSLDGNISNKHEKSESNKSFQLSSLDQSDCCSQKHYVEDKQRKVVPPLSFDKLANFKKRTEIDAYNQDDYRLSLMHLVTHRYNGNQNDYSRCFDRHKINDYATTYSKTFRLTEKTSYCPPIVYLYNKQVDENCLSEKMPPAVNIAHRIKKNSKLHNFHTELRCRQNNSYLPTHLKGSVDVSENFYQNPLNTSRLGLGLPSTTQSAK
ncbi:probable serine/threonine-protein kinase fhkE isoform X2 [Hylaeus volcanicus]|nr:probable serine/threonine-protein kinase fhkE isoform X2 [Hylaeus volcanicus]